MRGAAIIEASEYGMNNSIREVANYLEGEGSGRWSEYLFVYPCPLSVSSLSLPLSVASSLSLSLSLASSLLICQDLVLS